jgi:TolB protein
LGVLPILTIFMAGTVQVLTADATPIRLTTHPANDVDPFWSWATDQIGFVSNRAGYGSGKGPWYHSDIWVMNPDGSNKRAVTNAPWRDGYYPSWSPDGSKIVFSRTGRSYWSTDDDIAIVDVDRGETSVEIIFTYGDGQCAAWSPDGQRIAFTGAGAWEIFTITPDGSGLTQVTNFGRYPVEGPDWSPDGSKIACEYYTTPSYSIWVVDSHATMATLNEATMITDDGFHPVWSPDGTMIAFSSERSGNRDIWAINVNGTNLVQITTDPADDVSPAWSPDGSKIAFASNRAGGNWDIWYTDFSPSDNVIPEPGTMLLMGTGLVGLASRYGILRRRKK